MRVCLSSLHLHGDACADMSASTCLHGDVCTGVLARRCLHGDVCTNMPAPQLQTQKATPGKMASMSLHNQVCVCTSSWQPDTPYAMQPVQELTHRTRLCAPQSALWSQVVLLPSSTPGQTHLWPESSAPDRDACAADIANRLEASAAIAPTELVASIFVF